MKVGRLPYVSLALAAFLVTVYAGHINLPPLSAVSLTRVPHSLLTYVAVHAGATHLCINVAVVLCAGAVAEKLGGHMRTLLIALISIPVAGLVFCATTAGINPDTTLEGASSVALALAAYAAAMQRTRLPLMLLGLLCAAMIFGPNAGGGIAHCTGFATGAVAAMLHSRSISRRTSARDTERCRIRRKAEDSGYSSLSEHERKILNTPQ